MRAMTAQLADGEEIIWEDAPCYQSYRAHRLAARGAFALVFSGIAWIIVGAFFVMILTQDPTHYYPYTDYLPAPAIFLFMPLIMGLLFSIPFFMWIAECFTIRDSWRDTYFVITNRRVIIQSAGIVRREIKASLIRELSGAFLKIDWMDRIYHTGTVRLMFNNLNFMHTQSTSHGSRSAALNEIRHIDNAEDVFAKVQKLITEGGSSP